LRLVVDIKLFDLEQQINSGEVKIEDLAKSYRPSFGGKRAPKTETTRDSSAGSDATH